MEGRWPGRHVARFPRPLAFRLSLFALIRLGRTSRAPLVACYFSLPSTHLPQSSGCACVRLPTFPYDPPTNAMDNGNGSPVKKQEDMDGNDKAAAKDSKPMVRTLNRVPRTPAICLS